MLARPHPRLWQKSVGVPAGFLVATGALVAGFGVPYQRDLIAVWLVLGLLCCSLSDLRGYARGMLLDFLPFIGVLIAYDSLRGTAGHLLTVHYLPQLQVDQWLFGGSVPTVALQHWLWHGHVAWYDVALWAVYLTHFFATPVLAAVLWKRHRARFRGFAVFVATLSVGGLLTYALYPAAPPWMAAKAHLMPHVVRIIPHVWPSLGLHSAGSLVEHGYRYANDVAAVPSLHAGFSLMVAITLWPRQRRWLRPLVAAYPVAMAFALVLGGEHYVFDILLGWLYAGVAAVASRVLLSWWQRRAGAEAPGVAGAERARSRRRGAGVPEPVLAEGAGS